MVIAVKSCFYFSSRSFVDKQSEVTYPAVIGREIFGKARYFEYIGVNVVSRWDVDDGVEQTPDIILR